MTPAPRLDGTMTPEAAVDELPEGIKPLAAVMQELAAVLPGLKLALRALRQRKAAGRTADPTN